MAHIIIGESTWAQVQDRIATRELDAVRVKGKDTAVRVFEVMGFLPLPTDQQSLVQHLTQGLRAYRAQQWERAIDCFWQTLELKPDDRPSQLYIQRCEAFKRLPPPPDWDGVYRMPTK